MTLSSKCKICMTKIRFIIIILNMLNLAMIVSKLRSCLGKHYTNILCSLQTAPKIFVTRKRIQNIYEYISSTFSQLSLCQENNLRKCQNITQAYFTSATIILQYQLVLNSSDDQLSHLFFPSGGRKFTKIISKQSTDFIN